MTRTIAMIAVTLAAFAAPAAAEMITKPSAYSVPETADRLADAIAGAGATVVARVPHSDAAASVDMALPASVLMIFGNPRVGTPVMQEDLRAGLVLPLRVLIHDDGDGDTAVTYATAATLFSGMDVDLDGDAATRIDGALAMLTDKATRQ